MKKVIYSDDWGAIVEYRRYRGRNGQYITAKYARRWLGKRRIIEEVEQWRYVGKKRTERIQKVTPTMVEKTTYPGSVADNEGNIYNAIESSNIFTQVSKATHALINIRGYDPSGQLIRLQSEIEIGERNQDQQLAWAVRELLSGEGFRTQYNLKIVKTSKARNRAKGLTPLIDMQFTITLLQ